MTVRDFARSRGGRARPVGRGVRPRARGEERGGARVGARQRPHQHRRVPRVPRGVRARARPRPRSMAPAERALRRARLRPADDEHGARRRRSSRSRATSRARRLLHAVARDRRARRPLGRGLARARHAERPRCAGCSRRTRSTSRPRAGALRPGATAHDVHRAVSKGFTDRGYHLGHVTGHSIGMTMIEFPKIGEGVETELAANMVFSMHPHAIADDGWSASTCRTRGSSRPTAASRSPGSS